MARNLPWSWAQAAAIAARLELCWVAGGLFTLPRSRKFHVWYTTSALPELASASMRVLFAASKPAQFGHWKSSQMSSTGLVAVPTG